MKLKTFIYFTLLIFIFGCNDKSKINQEIQTNEDLITEKANVNIDTLRYIPINSDSINLKNTKAKLEILEPVENIYNNNVVFHLEQNGKYVIKDTLSSRVYKIEYRDFNGDNYKDLLIQNISDVRSNWTYYLYITDIKKNTLKKIRGFENIKNPKYNPEYDIIENYVMSGRNWTEFYKISADSIYTYDISIYDDLNGNGGDTYEKDYQQALKKIAAKN